MGIPLRLLIVEDSEDDARLVLRELRRGGYDPEFERVETPESMKAALGGREWDLVLSDHVLPKFSGPAALSVLKESGLDLPFLIVSGNIGEDIAVEAMRAGAHDYILKGNLTRLVPAVERELREAGVRRERRRAEKALQDSEERYALLMRYLVEQSLVGFFIVQGGRIVFLNPEQERIFGPGRTACNLAAMNNVHPQDRERFAALCEEKGTDDSPRAETGLRFLADSPAGGQGEVRWVDGRAVPIAYRGGPALLVNMVDVTKAREMEQVAAIREKMASLGQITATIAHEIRNPLSGLNVYLSVLENFLAQSGRLDGEAREKAQDIARKMRGASEKIENVIQRVMELSRPAAEKLSPVQVNRAVLEAVPLFQGILRKGGVRLATELADDLPECDADPVFVELALLNMVTNAAQAMETTAGDRKIAISTRLSNSHVVISVEDSGPGVPEALRRRIFDPLYTTKDGGLGIGLSFCRRVAALHAGYLEVGDSRLGGAAFLFGIPVIGAARHGSGAPAPPP